MKRIHLCLAPIALAATVGAVVPAHASPTVSAFAVDGRELFVGSVVTEGALSGDVCTFADGAVSVVLGDDSGAAAVTLTADSACRLVVTALGSVTESDVDAERPLWRRPKIDHPESTVTPAGVPGLPGIGLHRR